MIKSAVEPWLEPPLRQFVQDAEVSLALLLNRDGQVLAQHGFTRAMDIMSACALASAIHISARELGKQLDGKPFNGLHHAGSERQVFLAETETARGPYIFLTVFDGQSSLGLVRMYFEEFCANLASAAPPAPPPVAGMLGTDFELELNRNLAALFGRA